MEEIKREVERGEDEERPRRRKIGLEVILRVVGDALKVSRSRILSNSQGREASLARGLVAYLAKRVGEYSGSKVADFLHRDPSVIVRMVERVEGRIREEGDFKKLATGLARDLEEKGRSATLQS